MYKRMLLYYFSGTGNSRRAARWLAEDGEARGLTTHTVDVSQPDLAPAQPGPGDLVGLLGPTLGFSPAWRLLRFALALPRGQGASAFVLFTCGSLKVGRFFVPGFEGSGALLLALVLWLKGYQVRGAIGVDMPANWTAVHPALLPADCETLAARARLRLHSILGRILSGQKVFRGPILILLGLLLLPLGTAFLLMGRFFLAKLYYAASDCNGCGLCASSCPVRAIKMQGKNNPRPFWTFSCQSCMRCMNLCPRRAVEVSYPLAALMLYLSGLPVTALLLDALAPILRGTVAEWLLAFPYKLLTVALVYLPFIWLMRRVPQINRLLTLATPAHYFRRYQWGNKQ
jgi:NAD-dependent dihydropyrimidine dehydrogenase PreA subunit